MVFELKWLSGLGNIVNMGMKEIMYLGFQQNTISLLVTGYGVL